MKNQLTLTLVLGLLGGAGAASAHDFGGPQGHWGHDRDEGVLPGVLGRGFEPKEGPCAQLKLDASQKTKLKEAHFKFEGEKIDLESQIKKAHLKYEQVMANPDADLKAAQEASQGMVSSVTAMIQARLNHKNEVNFGILKGDQRGLARACRMSMHPHFGRDHGGPGPMSHKMRDKKGPQKDGPEAPKE